LESGARDLELADDIFTELIWDAGAPYLLRKKGVVIIATVDSVIVVISGDTIKADHSEVAVGGGTWSQQSEVGEVASIERKGFDALLADDSSKRRLSRVYQRSVGSDRHDGIDFADSELGMQDGASPHRDGYVFENKFAEATLLYRDFIGSRVEIESDEVTVWVTANGGGEAGILIADGNFGIGNSSARRIGYGTFQSSGGCGRLRVSESRREKQKSDKEYGRDGNAQKCESPREQSGHLSGSSVRDYTEQGHGFRHPFRLKRVLKRNTSVVSLAQETSQTFCRPSYTAQPE
jgi:hypothetical protein